MPTFKLLKFPSARKRQLQAAIAEQKQLLDAGINSIAAFERLENLTDLINQLTAALAIEEGDGG